MHGISRLNMHKVYEQSNFCLMYVVSWIISGLMLALGSILLGIAGYLLGPWSTLVLTQNRANTLECASTRERSSKRSTRDELARFYVNTNSTQHVSLFYPQR